MMLYTLVALREHSRSSNDEHFPVYFTHCNATINDVVFESIERSRFKYHYEQ